MALLAPLSMADKKFRWTGVLFVVVLLLSRSMGGFLALLAGVYICFIIFTKFRADTIAVLLSIVACAVLIFVWRIMMGSDINLSWIMRFDYWRNTSSAIHSSPLIGIGPGNLNIPNSLYAHNSYLQIWAECGIFAVVGFIWLCGKVIVSAARSYFHDPAGRREIPFIACSVMVFLLNNVVDFSYYLPEIGLYGGLFWALCYNLLRITQPRACRQE